MQLHGSMPEIWRRLIVATVLAQDAIGLYDAKIAFLIEIARTCSPRLVHHMYYICMNIYICIYICRRGHLQGPYVNTYIVISYHTICRYRWNIEAAP